MADFYDGEFSGGFTTENAPNSQSEPRTRTSLTPVTIKQINDATQPIPDGNFKVNNVELNMISFVGIVRSVDSLPSAISVTIEDGTGTTNVRKWVDENSGTPAEAEEKYRMYLDKYVYVTGALKSMSNKSYIQNASVMPVKDHNQVLSHVLSAIHHHLLAQGIKPRPKDEKSLFVSESASTSAPQLSIKERIMKVVRDHSPSMVEGVPPRLISQIVGIGQDEVTKICTELVDRGELYGGSDDNTYLLD
ncbi:predicted protein [Scheffersomyces stipitis CBS 6054]|uniref:Replication protein A C-terminal domain-containing protein n=1 Tax=Scheffersomyces stipitis (strain ATCC 58785 / CBS 6054 / NBRC 10063 / NRRL Y-11545) TaxID=322104 RepID=A3LYC8_PICST|nr:predicted protein [Scheffersomyces stipitis CBS 6054]ABN67609.2 predicted protein [Scheffersomyces stipitis CBS 6054]KAG2732384.1 hypothetical protein G9P44_004801 [Scheffersomyces stipitis]